MSGDIPVVGTGSTIGLTNGTTNYGLAQASNPSVLAAYTGAYDQDVGGNINTGSNPTAGNGIGLTTDPEKSGMVADTSSIDPIAIDTLHLLTQIERLNQRDNMWGTRDFECIRTHFGNTISDTRLQRPMHLGYSEVDVHFSEVVQTSQTTTGTGGSAQGTITGHSLAVDKSHPIRFYCQEWGFLFVMVNVQPIAQYQQGIPRDALYKTRYDYMWPLLSETGEQELFEAELYATGTNVNSRKIFGFEPRYNHLRFGRKLSMVILKPVLKVIMLGVFSPPNLTLVRTLSPLTLPTVCLALKAKSSTLGGCVLSLISSTSDVCRNGLRRRVLVDCFN